MGEAGEEPASRRGLFRHGGRVVRHCAREIASFPVPLLLSSAVLIVKDVDVVVVVLRIATMGAFKGVEGINGPSVRVRGCPSPLRSCRRALSLS